MVSRTGPTMSALFLLCCVGSWLSSHTSPIRSLQSNEEKHIVEELGFLSKILLENFRKGEKKLSTSPNYTLPCFIPNAQPPNNINISAVQTYLRRIRPLSDNTTTTGEIIEHLDKLAFQNAPETNISMPEAAFEKKRFILTILQQFVECVDLVLKSFNSEAQQAT
ncbi:interleukin-31 [Nycticebus coucang]|uniref:interleukin-31 n=1 Tax=Nycticebus coucang TaxID=9470 RepID=UPI00234D8327|nr:interleukin-31 [Nycticebus coucang]